LGESWSRNFRRTNSRPSHVRGSASTGGGTGGPQLPAARRPRGRRQGSAGQAVRHRQRHGCGSLRRHRSTGSNRSNRSTGSSRQTRSTALIRQTRSRPPSRPTGRSKTTAPTRPTRRTVRTPRNATTERTPPSETTGIRPLPQPTDRVTAGSTRSGFPEPGAHASRRPTYPRLTGWVRHRTRRSRTELSEMARLTRSPQLNLPCRRRWLRARCRPRRRRSPTHRRRRGERRRWPRPGGSERAMTARPPRARRPWPGARPSP